MGKIPFKLNDLTFCYATGEYCKNISIDEENKDPIKLNLFPYFRYSDLQN